VIGTIETRKIITVELERSELYNLLRGDKMRSNVQVRHKTDDTPVDIEFYCSNPELNKEVIEEGAENE